MGDNTNVTNLPDDLDIEKIKALPTRKITYAGVEHSGHFDAENSKFYVISEDGTSVRVATVSKKEKPPSNAKQSENEVSDKNAEAEKEPKTRRSLKQILKERAEGKKKEPKPRKEKEENKEFVYDEDSIKRKKILFIVCAIIIFLILASVGKSTLFSSHSSNNSSYTSTTATGNKNLNSIEVIQVNQDLIPGDKLTSDKLQVVSIDAETYNIIYLGNAKLYQASRLESLLNTYAVTYIPQGQYLTYDNVAASYYQEPNPWINETAGMVYVTIPLSDDVKNIDEFSYGSIVDLTITKQTITDVNRNTTSDNQESAASGLEHQTSIEQSYVIDTYALSNVIICDILNTDENSLYGTYTSWIAIPTGERLSYIENRLILNSKLEEKLQPEYAKIKITAEQAEELGNLISDDVSISYDVKSGLDASTESKSVYAAEVRALLETISEAIELAAARASEE